MNIKQRIHGIFLKVLGNCAWSHPTAPKNTGIHLEDSSVSSTWY